MADTGNIVDDIITDHREFESVFTEIETGGDPHSQPDLVEHVIAGIVRHAVAEEQYLYPAARKVLSNGDKLADHELVRKLIGEIRHHIEDEEQDMLAELRNVCSPEELRELSEKFQRAKSMAPTRPHPLAPDHPPANKILAPGAGLVDRLRDALSGRNA